MSAILNFPQIPLTEIFANRAGGSRVDCTVITPNRRLAITLKREFDAAQAAPGISAWDSADILPISAFIERIYEDALYSGSAAHLPMLLTPAQEQVLWEDAITHSGTGAILLSAAEAARLACEAWQLAHEWHLIPPLRNFPLNDDCKAFRGWSQYYENMTRRACQIDRARLCTLVTGLCDSSNVSKPKRVVCYGFDIVTPQQAALFTKLGEAGCEVLLATAGAQPPGALQAKSLNVSRVVCDDDSNEIKRAAVWARARIETDGSARIGIVVPRLSEYRNKIVRIFGSIMEPDVRQSLPGVSRQMPFNVSLGTPLISYPLVNAAFLALELAAGEIEFERASLLLRTPFLGGSETEMLHRARLDVQLRKRAEPRISLERLLILLSREHDRGGCPVLVELWSACAKFCKATLPASQRPSLWARAISEILRIIGFPGERGLDSSEYQAFKKWQEVLADFAALDNVAPRISYGQALSRLRRMTAETLFQPETPDVPIQILGAFEAAGMAFDHLWVMGLSDEAWPLQPRPIPFLPLELQRTRQLPQGSALASLQLSKRLTNGWLAAAEEVILSHPRRGGERDAQELAPSPLIANIAACELALPHYVNHRDLIHSRGRLEQIKDHPARTMSVDKVTSGTLSGGRVSGGTAVIKDQASCPFRAFAIHRLRAEGLKTPRAGLEAMERGTLVHYMLAQVWSQLKSKSALDAINNDDLEALLRQAAEEAMARIRRNRPATLAGRFAMIEQQRLIRLAREWLNEDRKRGDFKVVSIEVKHNVELGGLAMGTRLDRVDELADGRRIVIDYKTRAPVVNTMLGDRPDEPQLPLYLITVEPDAVAVAFAQVRIGEMRFTALAGDSDLLPGVKEFSELRQGDQYGSWKDLVAGWRTNLERLAADFSGGHALVDPKTYPHTCRNCDVRPLCRIYERAGTRLSGQGDDDEDE